MRNCINIIQRKSASPLRETFAIHIPPAQSPRRIETPAHLGFLRGTRRLDNAIPEIDQISRVDSYWNI